MKKETTLRKLQIGVMGSAADLKYSKKFEKQAEEIGYWIAKNKVALIFGAEKDFDSLSTAACRGAKKANGLTIGVTYGKGLDVYEKNVDVVIATGLERGGGRELPLVLSCDAIVALNGGSGTLAEIAIAYQANIPVVVLKGSGGWSQKLAGKYLDNRKRIKVEVAKTPKSVVELAIKLAKNKLDEEQSTRKDILFVGATHGDEKLGVDILKILSEKQYSSQFDWIVGNPRAFNRNKRYIDTDLNRALPGLKTSKKYEERRAKELMEFVKKYKFVIDIHGTNTKAGIFAIVSKLTIENLFLSGMFKISRVVIWPSITGRKTGPLNQFVLCGIEIECGPQGQRNIQNKLEQIITAFLENYKSIKPQEIISNLKDKEFYWVYDKLIKYQGTIKLVDFKKIKIANEEFYPLFVDRYKGLKYYKMKKIDFSEIFNSSYHHRTPL